ncbi:hypothetical protein ACH3XX_29790 [Streptomyces scabiei]|uniref:hypothetical protein n=1 Tax=Streptomyces TaxID=1883 RepID=UPI00099EAC28|nr:hypothetical protein [Streptomyces scabiei]MDX2836603.1 hypothetical protein [Streptomyces scabiei]MDX3275706.1 hypothetical protein [Streptomyces scabiei]
MTARVSTRWVTGDCWLGCERTSLLVIWLGPVQWDGQHAPFMACEDCLNRIKAQALTHFKRGNSLPANEGTYHVTDHRLPEATGVSRHSSPDRNISSRPPRRTGTEKETARG